MAEMAFTYPSRFVEALPKSQNEYTGMYSIWIMLVIEGLQSSCGFAVQFYYQMNSYMVCLFVFDVHWRDVQWKALQTKTDTVQFKVPWQKDTYTKPTQQNKKHAEQY